MTDDEKLQDRFGLPKLSTNQEVAVSFTLFSLGILLILSALYPLSALNDLGPAFLGVVMVATGYAFAIESIREFEEKDHFLSRRLMKE